APNFGFAWTRVAELLFSFGKIQDAEKALDRGVQFAPRNAQSHALRGFLLAAENRIGDSRKSFDQAITLDGALANAWLGRGLTSIRRGHAQEGERDMQVAAALEPNRSILRSYLGKAYSQVGSTVKANRELDRAKQLDPNDPTPWLYSAIERQRENRYNEAVDDLEKSVELNDNRRVYRSKFLLDQDRAVRGTNLASMYLNEGMTEQSVREAVRAVNNDYGSAAAHLFLANSYDALRDPTRVVLRYETAWFNELLLSNLLSPVGGGSLSQFVSQQEYSKLFEKDGFGISSTFDYRSDGQLRETASQFGTFGNFSYALDADYQYNRGVRLNNALSDLEYTGTFKFQLGIADSLFMQVRISDLRAGDVFQYYNPTTASSKTTRVTDNQGNTVSKTVPNQPNLTYHLHDDENPGTLLLGWHHEWSPGNHTLLLLGRQASDQDVTVKGTSLNVVTRDVGAIAGSDAAADVNVDPDTFAFTVMPHFSQIRGLTGLGTVQDVGSATFDLNYRSKVELYSAELQQIATLGMQTFVLGGRYQSGQFNTTSSLSNVGDSSLVSLVDTSASQRSDVVNFQRLSLYLYDTVHLAKWLSITGGVTYDSMRYPDNYRNAPTNGQQTGLDKVSPKVGIVIEPWRGAAIRAAYTEAISGTSFDESLRLEPTQVAGFLQAYRSIASESLIGSVAGSKYRFAGLSFEQKLPTRTYFGIEYNRLVQNLDQTVGSYDFLNVGGDIAGIEPSSLEQTIRYHEDILTITLNQLVGDRWAFGTRYRFTRSQFNEDYPTLSNSISNAQYTGAVDNLAKSSTRDAANFHEISLYALYNHPSGFFARAEANWYQQSNDSFVTDGTLSTVDDSGNVTPILQTTNQALASSDFWQFNVLAGYRFHRNQCEVSCGVLNIGGRDYRLNPVNPYAELPRERTFVVRCKLVF
ncbi:MAG: TonB-dependent receptor, partial [Chthoniobacteraceae bacterium]